MSISKTFVEKAVINMEKHNEVKSSPSYFWKNEIGAIDENFDAKHLDKSRYENMPLSTTDKIMTKRIEKDVMNTITNDYQTMLEEKFIPTEDVINHPKHYNSEVFPQAIDMMLQMFGKDDVLAFCKLNAFKYRMRAGIKDSNKIDEDIKKAMWYENKFKELNQFETEEKQILKG